MIDFLTDVTKLIISFIVVMESSHKGLIDILSGLIEPLEKISFKKDGILIQVNTNFSKYGQCEIHH